jgi:RNA polymerase sigma factor (sigma-70 family)
VSDSIGSPEQFAALVQQYRPLLAKTAIGAGVLPRDVDDVIQISILSVLENRTAADGTWRPMDKPAMITYLKTRVESRASNHLRGGRRERIAKAKVRARAFRGSRGSRTLPHQDNEEYSVERQPLPLRDEEQERGLVAAGVARAFSALSADHQELIRLVEWEGHTVPEVAKELGVPKRTIERGLRDARAALRSLLADLDPGGVDGPAVVLREDKDSSDGLGGPSF